MKVVGVASSRRIVCRSGQLWRVMTRHRRDSTNGSPDMMHEQTCLGVLKTLFCAALVNVMRSFIKENIELSACRVSSPKSSASRRRGDVSITVPSLYGYTVYELRVAYP